MNNPKTRYFEITVLYESESIEPMEQIVNKISKSFNNDIDDSIRFSGSSCGEVTDEVAKD